MHGQDLPFPRWERESDAAQLKQTRGLHGGAAGWRQLLGSHGADPKRGAETNMPGERGGANHGPLNRPPSPTVKRRGASADAATGLVAAVLFQHRALQQQRGGDQRNKLRLVVETAREVRGED
ncbi:hypothetical protein GCM10027034_10570 [Ramlibacter solisilvae]